MSYNIDLIQNYTSTSGVFFFDTNIWKLILTPKIGHDYKFKEEKYINFFERVIKDEGGKIAVNKLLLLELINTYMHVIAVKAFEEENNTIVPKNEFKTKYRPTQHYADQYEIICDDITARADSFIYYDIDTPDIDLNDAAKFTKLDFNDYCFYQTALKHDLILVTDDFDFFLDDLKILTMNKKLRDEQYIIRS